MHAEAAFTETLSTTGSRRKIVLESTSKRKGTSVFKYVKANAKRLSDIKDDIDERTPELIEALAQLYLFPGTEYENHWRKEVWSKFPRMPRTKGRNKLPSKKDILQSSWRNYKDDTSVIMQWAVAHEENLKPNESRLSDTKTFKKLVYEYLDWLSDKLSANHVLSPQDVYQKLDDLGL